MIGWAVETLVATTLLMLLVLALRQPVRRAFGPGVAYALWLLPLARMILPPLPASWRESAAAPIAAPLAHAGDAITMLVAAPLGLDGAAAPGPQHPSLGLVLAGLWGLGVAAFLVWHWTAHIRFCRRMLAGSTAASTFAGGVRVLESTAAAGPLAFGVLRRYVAFPSDFDERYDAEERDLALAHELGHHARGDLLANWAALVVLAVQWFNPVAWRSFRAFRADQEMANDAWVMRGRSAAFRHAYGRAIVKAAHGGAIPTACHLHSVDALKTRLRMLAAKRKSRARTASGGAVISLIAVAALGLTASGTAAAEGLRAKVGDAVGIDLSRLPHGAPALAMLAAQQDDARPNATRAHHHLPPLPPVPPVPPVPGAAVVPPVPPVPPVPDADRIMADVPQVDSRVCDGQGDARQMVIEDRANGRKRIIICTDRIAQAAARGAQVAAHSAEIQRAAYRAAMADVARSQIEVQAQLRRSADERRRSMDDLNRSLHKMHEDLARQGLED
ncbi:MAG: M56 family metallopeptidase [Sphingomonas sp.]